MATESTVDIGKLVEEVLHELQKQHFPEYMKHIDRKEEILKIIEDTLLSEIKLMEEMTMFVDTENLGEMEKAMSAITSKERMRMIKDAFTIETYKMTIGQTEESNSEVSIQCEGQPFRQPFQISQLGHVIDARILQLGSVIMEILFLVLRALGIKNEVKAWQMDRIMDEIEPSLRSSAFQKAVNIFIKEWKAGGNWERAKAMFNLLQDTYALGIFWQIMKSFLSEMSSWDYIKATAEVAAMIIASLATGGIALVAKIALALIKAYNFMEKIANLITLEQIRRLCPLI